MYLQKLEQNQTLVQEINRDNAIEDEISQYLRIINKYQLSSQTQPSSPLTMKKKSTQLPEELQRQIAQLELRFNNKHSQLPRRDIYELFQRDLHYQRNFILKNQTLQVKPSNMERKDQASFQVSKLKLPPQPSDINTNIEKSFNQSQNYSHFNSNRNTATFNAVMNTTNSSNANMTPKIMPKAITKSPIIKFKNSGERVQKAKILIHNEDNELKSVNIFDLQRNEKPSLLFSPKDRNNLNRTSGFNPEIFRNL